MLVRQKIKGWATKVLLPTPNHLSCKTNIWGKCSKARVLTHQVLKGHPSLWHVRFSGEEGLRSGQVNGPRPRSRINCPLSDSSSQETMSHFYLANFQVCLHMLHNDLVWRRHSHICSISKKHICLRNSASTFACALELWWVWYLRRRNSMQFLQRHASLQLLLILRPNFIR